jgi:hypothetical protein
MKSIASELIFSKIGYLKLISDLTIIFLISFLSFPGKGFLPVRSINVITPILQISTFSLYF